MRLGLLAQQYSFILWTKRSKGTREIQKPKLWSSCNC